MKLYRVFLFAAAIAALFVLVTPVFADCPEDDPRCVILPPISREVSSAGNTGSLESGVLPTGQLIPLDPVIPMPPPPIVARELTVGAISIQANTPGLDPIDIPMRYQDPNDVSCGIQALGMALDALSTSPPSSNAIHDILQSRGFLYDFGTGSEELAYAAREFGYEGSVAFHKSSLEGLRGVLESGRPVVLDLGANGPDQPGHFVTLTGISDDWQWVAVNDPLLGKRRLPLAEFMRLWDLQDRSGVFVAQEPPSPESPDYSSWLALATAMMASLALGPTLLSDKKRAGTGGGIGPGSGSPSPQLAQELTHDPPPISNPIIVRVPYIESVVVGHKVVGRHLEKVTYSVPARRELINPGRYELQDQLVPYTAYRPKVIWIEKTVNEVRKITEKVTRRVEETIRKPVTSWARRTIRTPVTKWIRKTRTWFERTRFGRWIRKTRSWLERKVTWIKKTVWEPVKRWVTQKVVKPVTSWVTRTIIEPVKKWMQETVQEPYTAYRTEQVQVYIPPEIRYIPAHEETTYEWVEETVPIVREEIRWREVPINAGLLPGQVAQEFFNQIEPKMDPAAQMVLFQQFRENFGEFIDSQPSKVDVLSQMAFEIFFNDVRSTNGEMVLENWKMTNAFSLSIRSEAGSGSPVLGYIPFGSYLRWTSESQQMGETTWYKVQYYSQGELVEGWVSSYYLSDHVPGSSKAMLDFQMDAIIAEHGVDLDGDWDLRNKRAAALGIDAVAARFAEVLGIPKEEAFEKVLENLTLLWGTEPEAGDYLTPQCEEITAGACTSSKKMINFATLWSTGPYRPEDIAFQASVNNVVHELGHAFANLWWTMDPETQEVRYDESGPYAVLGHPEQKQLLMNLGFQDPPNGNNNIWRQHPEEIPTPNEVFADMFLGWVFNEWQSGKRGDDMSAFIEENMVNWLGVE